MALDTKDKGQPGGVWKSGTGKGRRHTKGRQLDDAALAQVQALLGDAIEAVIAAVYIDAGFDAAKAMVLRLWGARIHDVEEDARDPKTALQEWAQARGLKPPKYHELRRTGPDHAPEFTIAAELETGERQSATAGSKRHAEQAAAQALLRKLEDRP